MLVLQLTPDAPGGPPIDSEVELDFRTWSWKTKNGRSLWPGKRHCDHGPSERLPFSENLALLDGGPGMFLADKVILFNALSNDTESLPVAGEGMMYLRDVSPFNGRR